MKKYVTPDFDVTIYEVVDKITADISIADTSGSTDEGDWDWA